MKEECKTTKIKISAKGWWRRGIEAPVGSESKGKDLPISDAAGGGLQWSGRALWKPMPDARWIAQTFYFIHLVFY